MTHADPKGKPMPLDMAREAAGRVLEILRPHIVRGEICGSIRRGAPWVHDIDLVIEPIVAGEKKGEPCWTPALLDALASRTDLWTVGTKLHNQSRQVKLQSVKRPGTKCELYLAATTRYGWIVLLRTGPEKFTEALVNICRERPTPHMFRNTNLWCIDEGEERAVLVPTPNEEDVFNALEIPFMPPAERNEHALRRYMR